MDLQSRKLNLITYLSQIQDESFICEIEKMVLKNSSKFDEIEFKPFTQKELIERIKKSEKDFISGNFKTQEELEIISDTW